VKLAGRREAAGVLLAVLFLARPALAEEKAAPPEPSTPSSAQVEVDGVELFRVIGVQALPAAERAADIARRIEQVAADRRFKVEDLRTQETDLGTSILAGDRRVMLVTDDDARLQGVGRKVIAAVYAARLRTAIEHWRAERSPESLRRSTVRALVVTLFLGVAVGLALLLWRRLRDALEQRYRARIHSVGIQSFQLVRAENIWKALRKAIASASMLTVLVLAFAYLHYVLLLFPWTRGTGVRLLEYVLNPLRILGSGLMAELPNVLFLVILFVITRWLLKLIHLFFGAIGRREVKLSGFEAEWAEPTYKLVRLLVLVLALVVAYPYIPGSGSEAFKGLSIFIGVVFSLGSSSAIANMIAGYLMTYRRAFRVGDRIKVQGFVGDVTEVRLQVTHLRTVKNEEVVIPNSTILNNEIVNYSALTHTAGLILHTTVGIGYETPWRQVEAMLLMAAERTPGLKREPAPFVRQQSLGDFAVTYELNVYCDNAQAMGLLYAELHRHILDVFNEYGVQIMTPAYEGDPPEPKVVPKENWYTAPATPTAKET
jgi:small-conductance mechanosensitive channel